MFWNLYNQTPTATTTTTWIPVNMTTSGTNWPLYMPPQFPITIEESIRRYGQVPRSEYVPYTPAIIRRLTDRHDREELAAARQERQETRRLEQQAIIDRQLAERLARVSAGERAKELLLAHLTPEQRHTFEKNEWFVVEGGRTKKKYKIYARNNSLNANIEVIGENHRLCAHCDHHVMPFNDHVLMQKVMIELDEDSFLRVANRHPMR
jgi:hypothetical protein